MPAGRRTLLPVFCAWALLAGLSACRVQGAYVDEVTLTTAGATVLRGEIKKESLKGIEIEDERGQKLPDFGNQQIVSIIWDLKSDDWVRGNLELNSGNFEAAAASLDALIGELRTVRRVVQPYLFLRCGEAFFRAGKPQEAADRFEAIPRDYPDSRYVPEAIDRLLDIQIQLKNTNRARELLKRLSALGGSYAVKAILYDAELDLLQGRADEASRKFEQAARSTTDSETRVLGHLGQARCAVIARQFDKAKQTAQQALEVKGVTPAVAGMAHLIIGSVLLQEAETAKDDPGKFLDAALEFQRVVQMYPGDERTEPEALFKTGEVFRLLSKLRDRNTELGRAVETYNALRRKYPGSRWAKQAGEVMQKLR